MKNIDKEIESIANKMIKGKKSIPKVIKPKEPTLIIPIHNINIPTEISHIFVLTPYNPKKEEIKYGVVSRSMIAEIS